MDMLTRLKSFIDELDDREYYKYLLILLGAVIIFMALLFYFHGRKISRLKKEIHKVNRQRKSSRELLERHEIVKNQKIEVDEILSQDKTFKIKEYFLKIIEELNLKAKSSKRAELSAPQDLENGYSEISLNTSFTNITMQDLCGLLYEAEKNTRIYIKDLSITKAPKMDTLDVTLSIATLQPKATT